MDAHAHLMTPSPTANASSHGDDDMKGSDDASPVSSRATTPDPLPVPLRPPASLSFPPVPPPRP